jgi:excisionase family DNA binding protein
MRLQPLNCHPRLLPGESLPSLLARLAKVNNYEPRSILSSIIRESANLGQIKRLGCPSQALFEIIMALTNIEICDLYKASAHYFTCILTPPEIEIECIELSDFLSVPFLLRGIANKNLRPENAGQFCPLCLKASAYHRLIWLPLASAVCLEHKCLLVNACPRCEDRVGIQDIIESRCSRCKTDLTEAQSLSVANDSFGLFTQGVIQTWLMEGRSPVCTTFSLPDQMPRDLYRVVDGMRISILQVNQDWPLLHHADIQQHSVGLLPDARAQTLTPYQSYCLYATACKGIIDWPRGFHLFLTAYRDREKKSRYADNSIYNGVTDELGNLYVQWLNRHWKQPTLSFVDEAFKQYLVDNHTSFASALLLMRYKDMPELIDNLSYISMHEAAKLLGTTREGIKFMIKSAQLISYYEQGKSWAALVKREDVMALRDKWEQAIDIKEVMDWLGLSKKTVLNLVRIGLLTAQQSNAKGSHWKFSPSAVTACLERIVQGTSCYVIDKVGNAQNMISLREASLILYEKLSLGGAEFTLQQVAENKLRAYFPTNQKLRLGNLLFSRVDIDAYIETVKAEKGWIERGEVASILGTGKASLSAWTKAGLISPTAICANIHYYDRKTIENLRFDCVTVAEAAKVLGVQREAVRNMMHQGRLKVLMGPDEGIKHFIFSRKNLLQWRSTRATLEEASQLLGVSKNRLVYWVQQNVLPPLDDKKQNPWYFSHKTLLELKSEQKHDTLITEP